VAGIVATQASAVATTAGVSSFAAGTAINAATVAAVAGATGAAVAGGVATAVAAGTAVTAGLLAA